MYVCIIGGANIDMSGRPYNPLIIRDSNPCRSKVSLGGVARNIAENCSRLGAEVKFISVLGDDKYADMIRSNANSLGIDVSHCLSIPEENTSTYVCINDHLGDMYLAVSDMDILNYLTPEYLSTKLDVINGGSCMVVDTNVPNCIKYMQDNATVPLFVDTVSANKTKLIADDLHNIFCLKPNTIEAEILSGVTITDYDSAVEAIKVIHSKGVKWVILTQGADGVMYSDGTTINHMPAYNVEVVNTTGAGDSFIGAVVAGYASGKNIEQCVALGCAVASITITDKDTVSSKVSMTAVSEIIAREK